MKTTVNFSQFVDRFNDMGRGEQFSYDGKRALFDYLEEYEDSTGEEVELDVIALCVEYTEYEDLEEIKEQYSDYFDAHEITSLEDLQDHTQVIEFDTGVIIQDF